MFELICAEYHWTIEQVKKLTRREISALIDANASRKSGYKKSEAPTTIELSKEQDEAIKKALAKRFKG